GGDAAVDEEPSTALSRTPVVGAFAWSSAKIAGGIELGTESTSASMPSGTSMPLSGAFSSASTVARVSFTVQRSVAKAERRDRWVLQHRSWLGVDDVGEAVSLKGTGRNENESAEPGHSSSRAGQIDDHPRTARVAVGSTRSRTVALAAETTRHAWTTAG